MDFLHREFKLAGKITRPHSELTVALDSYLDALVQEGLLVPDGKSNSREKADTYLGAWCSNSIGWMKRFFEEKTEEPIYQLTAEFEKALAFVEKATDERSFIGTESRLRTILEVLGNVVAGVDSDPKSRLEQLARQRTEIDEEIKSLEASPARATLSATQVRERFQLATQQLSQLKSEFRAVEDRFKSITRGVQQRIIAASDSRGEILQFALDSEDMLKHGDQGRSFFEFLKLIHSPESQDQINELVERLSEVEALAAEHDELAQLRTMVPTLIAEAEKILRTTQHLSTTLRRLLDARSTRHHQQLSKVLRDILGAAAEKAEEPPAEIGIEVEVELEIQCPMDRPFWSATDPFDEVDLQAAVADPAQQKAAMEQMLQLERLDWSEMRERVRNVTVGEQECALTTLLERYPIEAGAVEVLGYLQIAHDDGHRIDRTQTVQLKASQTGKFGRALSIPNVVFLPQKEDRDRGGSKSRSTSTGRAQKKRKTTTSTRP